MHPAFHHLTIHHKVFLYHSVMRWFQWFFFQTSVQFSLLAYAIWSKSAEEMCWEFSKTRLKTSLCSKREKSLYPNYDIWSDGIELRLRSINRLSHLNDHNQNFGSMQTKKSKTFPAINMQTSSPKIFDVDYVLWQTKAYYLIQTSAANTRASSEIEWTHGSAKNLNHTLNVGRFEPLEWEDILRSLL